MNGRHQRSELLLGQASTQRLAARLAVVIGLGGVGGACLEALARAGVGRLRLVDPDSFVASNLNRQLLCTEATLGRSKVEVAAERVLAVDSSLRAEPLALACTAKTLDLVLAGPPDLVCDCCDSLGDKTDLLLACAATGIPLVVALGAALRRDVSSVRTGPLAAVTGCPLGRRLRQAVKAATAEGAALQTPCAYSIEAPVRGALAAPEAGQRRALGSLPTVPNALGLAVAQVGLELLLA